MTVKWSNYNFLMGIKNNKMFFFAEKLLCEFKNKILIEIHGIERKKKGYCNFFVKEKYLFFYKKTWECKWFQNCLEIGWLLSCLCLNHFITVKITCHKNATNFLGNQKLYSKTRLSTDFLGPIARIATGSGGFKVFKRF